MLKKIRTIKLILVEDSTSDATNFDRALSRDLERKWEVRIFVRVEDVLEMIARDEEKFDIFVADFRISGMNGLDLCKRVLDIDPLIPVALLTGPGSESIAAEAIDSSWHGKPYHKRTAISLQYIAA